MSKTVPFQTIQFSIGMQFKCKYTDLLSKIFLFQAIQFSQTVLIQAIPGQSGPGCDATDAGLRFPQSSCIPGTSPWFFSVICWKFVGGVLPLCRGAVGVIYSPSRLGKCYIQHTCWWGSYLSSALKSVFFCNHSRLGHMCTRVRAQIRSHARTYLCKFTNTYTPKSGQSLL